MNNKVEFNLVVVDDIQEGKGKEIPSVEQIEQAGSKIVNESQILVQDNEIHGLHYLSWIFGFLLSCWSVALIAIIPQHNILNEPEYWYEIVIFSASWGAPMLSASIFFQCIYWANINYAKNWATLFTMWSIGAIVTITIMGSYYLIWTFHFKLFAPMPFTYYGNGTFLFAALEVSLWFR